MPRFPCGLARFLALWRLLTVVGHSLSASELQSDDECSAGASGCSLQALQRRGLAKAQDTPKAQPAQPPQPQDASSADAADLQASFGCYDGSAEQYFLNWEANASNFFDDWTFVTEDPTNGAVNYLSKEAAFASGLIKTYQDHVTIKVGELHNGKRDSFRIQTNKAWDPNKSFLVAMKYRHMPYGAGVWPAFWTMNSDYVWPKGGELDIAEFSNDSPNLISLHVRGECKMSASKLNMCTPPTYTWLDSISIECDTDYGQDRKGCKPPQKRHVGEVFNMYPGVFVAEWNKDTIKVWHFPEGSVPDLSAPKPATWDPERLLTWIPFEPDSCKDAFAPQEIVLNTELCGDYSGNTWELTPFSYYTGYKVGFGKCSSGKDCCNKWIQDPRSSQYLNDYAVWDIDYVKVFTTHGAEDYAQESGTFLRHGEALHSW